MNAKEFMKEVYDKVSSGEPDVQEAEKIIGGEIRAMTEKYADRFTGEDMDIIRDMLYTVQTLSMREGYITGAKHAAALFSGIKRS